MNSKILKISSLASVLVLGACASLPPGPSVQSLPGSGKTFDQFRADDADCRSYASTQSGGQNANDAAVDSGVRSAAVGTVLGALAGAALGGHHGAGVGAGVGLLAGGVAGTSAGQESAYTVQQRYDNAYVQCMYAKGERVPVSGRVMEDTSRRWAPAAPQQGYYPPPQQGYYPPPPPAGS
ncbi:MAG: hypothetical protein IH605_00655 [Burkholderiales bacterium]|nr:hypothetical protein [Burkholderiales bacterium]